MRSEREETITAAPRSRWFRTFSSRRKLEFAHHRCRTSLDENRKSATPGAEQPSGNHVFRITAVVFTRWAIATCVSVCVLVFVCVCACICARWIRRIIRQDVSRTLRGLVRDNCDDRAARQTYGRYIHDRTYRLPISYVPSYTARRGKEKNNPENVFARRRRSPKSFFSVYTR